MLLSPTTQPLITLSQPVHLPWQPLLPPLLCMSCEKAGSARGVGLSSRALSPKNSDERQRLWMYLVDWTSGAFRILPDQLYHIYDLNKWLCGSCYDSHMQKVHKLMTGEEYEKV